MGFKNGNPGCACCTSTGTVSGVVRGCATSAYPTGHPVSGATVASTVSGTTYSTTSDASGNYSLAIPSGTRTLVTTPPAGSRLATKTETVTVTTGATTSHDVQLAAATGYTCLTCDEVVPVSKTGTMTLPNGHVIAMGFDGVSTQYRGTDTLTVTDCWAGGSKTATFTWRLYCDGTNFVAAVDWGSDASCGPCTAVGDTTVHPNPVILTAVGTSSGWTQAPGFTANGSITACSYYSGSWAYSET